MMRALQRAWACRPINLSLDRRQPQHNLSLRNAGTRLISLSCVAIATMGAVCCLKGFDARSFAFNTRAAP